MTDTTDWRAEAERLGALLDVSEQARQSALRALAEATERRMDEHARAEQYMAERNAARLEAQRDRASRLFDRAEQYMAERNAARLEAQRDRASRLFDSIATTHAKLAAWAREELSSHDQARFFAALANGAPDWKTAPRNLAVDLLAMTAERDAARAELAQARDVLADCAETLEGYARHHAERGPEHAHKVTRNAALAARCRAVLAAKGE